MHCGQEENCSQRLDEEIPTWPAKSAREVEGNSLPRCGEPEKRRKRLLLASDEIVGKSDYREALVRQQSARCMAGYIYASCGMGESTTDVVFGGDAMIAENGAILERGERFLDESQVIFADIDIQRLEMMRISEASFADGEVMPFRRIPLYPLPQIEQLNRYVDPHPFVPSKKGERAKRCREIFSIQAAALQKRLAEIMRFEPQTEDGQRLHRRYQKISENLFVFVTQRDLPATNNRSEQALRFSVIFRKVLNGFRSEWGKDIFANMRSVIDTEKLRGLFILQSYQNHNGIKVGCKEEIVIR